jgi:hypothetical protein
VSWLSTELADHVAAVPQTPLLWCHGDADPTVVVSLLATSSNAASVHVPRNQGLTYYLKRAPFAGGVPEGGDRGAGWAGCASDTPQL